MEALQKRPTLLALAAVVWFIWGGLASEPDAKGKSLDGLPRVTPEDVQVRPLDAPPVVVRNPFPPFMAPDDGGFGAAGLELESEPTEADDEPEVVEPPEPRIVIERRPDFVLRLDSIMALGADGGHARINGYSVGVGDPIPGCDDEAPPALVALEGLSATIRHRDALHQLHLDDAPVLALGGETIRHVLPPLPAAAEADG